MPQECIDGLDLLVDLIFIILVVLKLGDLELVHVLYHRSLVQFLLTRVALSQSFIVTVLRLIQQALLRLSVVLLSIELIRFTSIEDGVILLGIFHEGIWGLLEDVFLAIEGKVLELITLEVDFV